MLCPEISNFPPPTVFTTYKECENLDPIIQTLKMNCFYKNVIITCPDEVQTPSWIQEKLLEDSDYYKISKFSLTEFLETTFVDNFVKKGNLYGISTDRNCIVDNCASITPDGMLTIHVQECIFQTLGLEGKKRSHDFCEVNIDLKNLKHVDKIKSRLSKLELFDFYLIWEPMQVDVCPSSIAKYFHDRNVKVSLCSLEICKKNPVVTEIPSMEDVDIEEMVEWVGMLAHEVSMTPTETYISTYSQPESEKALKTNRVSVHIVKGLLTPNILSDLCRNLLEYTCSRELDSYWTSVSIQSQGDCLWQWKPSSQKMFQSHDASCNIFFTKTKQILYSVGQLKYS